MLNHIDLAIIVMHICVFGIIAFTNLNPITSVYLSKPPVLFSDILSIFDELKSKTNSLIKFPLKKIWQVNTDQEIDDENPYLPDPIYLSQNV